MADQGFSYQTDDGAMLVTNHDNRMEEEWDELVGIDPPPPNEASGLMPPPSSSMPGVELVEELEPLPQGWMKDGAPTKKCLPLSFGAFPSFKTRLKLYRRGNAPSDQICCWFSPYFAADGKVSQIGFDDDDDDDDDGGNWCCVV